MLPLCLQTHRLKIPGISRVSWKESVEMSGDFSKSLAIFGLIWPIFFFFLILIFSEMLRGAKQKYHELVSRTSEIEISRDLLNFEENYDRFKCFGKFKKPRVP